VGAAEGPVSIPPSRATKLAITSPRRLHKQKKKKADDAKETPMVAPRNHSDEDKVEQVCRPDALLLPMLPHRRRELQAASLPAETRHGRASALPPSELLRQLTEREGSQIFRPWHSLASLHPYFDRFDFRPSCNTL